jgi:hypothetical protein
MTSIAEQAEQRRADRARLQELLTALDAGEAQLRRDECGDWQIAGTRGHVYAMGSTFHLVVFVDEPDLNAREIHTGARWTWAKKRLPFAPVTQDGDDEGILRLEQLPTADQAIEIRDITRHPQAAALLRRGARQDAGAAPTTGAVIAGEILKAAESGERTDIVEATHCLEVALRKDNWLELGAMASSTR